MATPPRKQSSAEINVKFDLVVIICDKCISSPTRSAKASHSPTGMVQRSSFSQVGVMSVFTSGLILKRRFSEKFLKPIVKQLTGSYLIRGISFE